MNERVRVTNPAATLVLLCAAATLAGCGGSDRLAKDELVTQADAICAKYEKELDRLVEPQNLGEFADFTAEAVSITRAGNQELSDLEPPEELENDYDRWLELNDEVVDRAEEMGEAARDGDAEAVQAKAREIAQSERRADEVGTRIGLEECAND